MLQGLGKELFEGADGGLEVGQQGEDTDWVAVNQGVFLCTLRVCTLGFWVPQAWNMALNKGIWDPNLGLQIFRAKTKSL